MPASHRARTIGGVALGAAALLAAAALAWSLWRWNAREAAVTRSERVAVAVKKIATLSTVETTVSNWQLRKDSKQLFGFLPVRCEKTVALMYRGRVVAGFDLSPASGPGLEVKRTGDRLIVALPAPRVLTTEIPPPDLVVADGSVCNRLEADEYARLHEEARAAVVREALASGVLAKATEQARALIRGIAEPFGVSVQIVIDGADTTGAVSPR